MGFVLSHPSSEKTLDGWGPRRLISEKRQEPEPEGRAFLAHFQGVKNPLVPP